MTCMSGEEIRIYRLDGIAMAEGNKADLEMICPARKKLHQEIPIINKSPDNWNIRAFFQGSTAFSGPATIVAKAMQTSFYPLEFHPTYKGEQTTILNLTNNSTNQNFLYTLKGFGEEPLAEETYSIQCTARQQVNKLLRIQNTTNSDEEYDIVSGLPNLLSKPYVKVPANKWIDYKLMFQPNSCNAYKESVSLISRTTGDRLWYMFDVSWDGF
jgi:hypothetical protein